MSDQLAVNGAVMTKGSETSSVPTPPYSVIRMQRKDTPHWTSLPILPRPIRRFAV